MRNGSFACSPCYWHGRFTESARCASAVCWQTGLQACCFSVRWSLIPTCSISSAWPAAMVYSLHLYWLLCGGRSCCCNNTGGVLSPGRLCLYWLPLRYFPIIPPCIFFFRFWLPISCWRLQQEMENNSGRHASTGGGWWLPVLQWRPPATSCSLIIIREIFILAAMTWFTLFLKPLPPAASMWKPSFPWMICDGYRYCGRCC